MFPSCAGNLRGACFAAVTRLADTVHQKLFDALHARCLVYNSCWEDPAVDRLALAPGPADTLLVIASAGCNALDYALAGAGRVYAVDANPRQTALLELKLAGIRALDWEDFFRLFGQGRHDAFAMLYRDRLRARLSPFAREFWDRRPHWFGSADPGSSFYFRGLAGRVARAFRFYIDARPRLREAVRELLDCRTLDEQRMLYRGRVAPLVWNRGVEWALSRQVTMSLLGVPGAQTGEVKRQHPRGVAGFVRESVDYVFNALPLWTNYFWTVYLRGHYTPECAPEYLTPEGFAALKAGRVDAVEPHTCTVTGFLRRHETPITRFVLLDHMDWLGSFAPQTLAEEWRWILERAAPDARVIFRTAHADPAYLYSVRVPGPGGERPIAALGRFHPELAARLSREDRVHTYAGFHILDVAA